MIYPSGSLTSLYSKHLRLIISDEHLLWGHCCYAEAYLNEFFFYRTLATSQNFDFARRLLGICVNDYISQAPPRSYIAGSFLIKRYGRTCIS